MKKLIYSALGAGSLILGSCSNESAIPPQIPGGGDEPIGDGNMEIVGKIDDEHLDDPYQSIPNVETIADQVSVTYEEMNMYLSSVDPAEIDQEILAGYETQLMEMMSPLSALGSELRSELIRISNDADETFEMDSETLEIIQSLDDVQLIELGMIVSACLNNYEVIQDGEYSQVVGCLAEALGINDIITLAQTLIGGSTSVNFYISGTRALINAKTLARIAGAMGLRYLGIAGIAYGLYKFGKCMKG